MGIEMKMPVKIGHRVGGGIERDVQVVFHIAGPIRVLLPVQQTEFHVAENIESNGLVAVVGYC